MKRVEFDVGLGPREKDEPVSLATAAALLLAHFEAQGVIFILDDAGFLKVDLDPLGPELGLARADEISKVILCLREEIKAMLRARAVLH